MPGSIPRWALRHEMFVEPYLGQTGNGPSYGPRVSVRCHIEDGHRTKRGSAQASGRTVGDESTAWCELAYADIVTPEARVTIFRRVVEVTKVRRREFLAAATPNHLEITFI